MSGAGKTGWRTGSVVACALFGAFALTARGDGPPPQKGGSTTSEPSKSDSKVSEPPKGDSKAREPSKVDSKAPDAPKGDAGGAAGDRQVRVNAEMGVIEVPPPPFSDGVYPCSDCHNADRTPDPTRRELAEHDFKFEHDADHRWCLDCHSINNYDKLHLSSGELIDFDESFKLCGQCHGDKYRDWRAGVHGRRTGQWSSTGKKTYLLCVNCHNPHSPRFKPIKPLPAPVRPDRLRRTGG